MVIGMFPDCPIEKITSVGNAAGDGCRAVLLNMDKRHEADLVARQVEYIELTLEANFQHQLMAATQLPHMTDTFIHLKGIVPDKILNQSSKKRRHRN